MKTYSVNTIQPNRLITQVLSVRHLYDLKGKNESSSSTSPVFASHGALFRALSVLETRVLG